MKRSKVIAATVLALTLAACDNGTRTQLVCADAAGNFAFASGPVGSIYYSDKVYTWTDSADMFFRYVQPDGWLCAYVPEKPAKPVEATL